MRDSIFSAFSAVKSTPPLTQSREFILQSHFGTMRALMLSLLAEMDLLTGPTAEAVEQGLNLDDEVRRFEIELIRAALLKAQGSQTHAARMLGVKTTTLNTKIKRYQIQPLTPACGGLSRDETPPETQDAN